MYKVICSVSVFLLCPAVSMFSSCSITFYNILVILLHRSARVITPGMKGLVQGGGGGGGGGVGTVSYREGGEVFGEW